MGQSVKVSKGHPVVKALLALAFPGYRGRKVSVELAAQAYVEPVASGGTFDKVVAVNAAGAKMEVSFDLANAWKYSAGPLPVPEGVALVVHSYFCGKDVGVRIYVNPGSVKLAQMLTSDPLVAGLLVAKMEVA